MVIFQGKEVGKDISINTFEDLAGLDRMIVAQHAGASDGENCTSDQ